MNPNNIELFRQGRDFFARLLQSIHLQLEPREFVEVGDRLVVIARLHGKSQSSARPFDLTPVHVWTMRGNSAVR